MRNAAAARKAINGSSAMARNHRDCIDAGQRHPGENLKKISIYGMNPEHAPKLR